MVGCNFDCFGHDVGHLPTHEWTRWDLNHAREYLIWVPEYVIWVPGNVMLDCRVRNVGHIHTCDWTNRHVKLDMCGHEADLLITQLDT